MAGRRSATTASKAKGGGKPGKAQGRPDRVNTRSSSSSKRNRNDDAADDAAAAAESESDSGMAAKLEPVLSARIVSETLQCPVCFDVMNVPVTLHCGHSACKACLESCFASRSACPSCRTEVP